ncbi:polyketide synthase PksM/polyketide synthase PksN [Paenibacillus sp. CF095]|uniref:SDR family NAD(P)-dependent oxidoreductase n=1 Tax=Paenibacillus sp. CF095 TaxID=1881033 RepID=UPI00088F8C54|nr:SDR family NAD(P)-dependent oxidoreductase [Paenibacillus sp. CF095]SDD51918.1 polyketide synthase PksM/polyketide synthase PksN [Paenibacillus sp. CF095]
MEPLKLFDTLSNSNIHYGFNEEELFLDNSKLDQIIQTYIVNHKDLIIDFLKSRQFIDLALMDVDRHYKGGDGLDFLFVEHGSEKEVSDVYRSFLVADIKSNPNLLYYAGIMIALFVRYTDENVTNWSIHCKGKQLKFDTSNCTKQSKLADVVGSLASLIMKGKLHARDLDNLNIALCNADSSHVLAMNMSTSEDHVIITIKYNAYMIAGNTIDRIVNHYTTYLSGFDRNPDVALSTLSYLTVDELNKIKDWAGLTEQYPFQETLYDVFEQQAYRTPQDIAFIYDDNKSNVFYISYIDLLCSVDHLASEISQLNFNNQVIGYYGERTIYTVIAMLAVWKSGNIYLPLDTSYSEEHLQYMIEDAKVELIFTTDQRVSKISNYRTIVMTEHYLIDSASYEPSISASKFSLERDCLIMYTSGSTGKPKGVIHKQLQLINRFNWIWSNYPFKETSCMGQRTSMNFMPSMWEFLGGLLKGVSTVILTDSIVKDPNSLVRAIARHQISHLTVVPSLLKRILESPEDMGLLSNMQLCITAGEPLTVDLLNQFKDIVPQATLLNDYGATEVNGILYIDSKTNAGKTGNLPGFKPIRNVKVYVLDSDLNLAGVGIEGELHIGGAALATGYLNDDEGNAQKFIENPYKDSSSPRLYKMGDYARYLPDGTIELLGRRDHQVKIRGIKLELTGIERVIEQNSAIAECAVFVKELSQGVSRLYSAIAIRDGEVITDDQIHQFLKPKVSDYMIPSSFIRVEKLPRTPNGKVDRQQLLTLTGLTLNNPKPILNSESDIKEQLVSQAAQTLSIEPSLIESGKKFYALGFDSLTIVDFLNAINKRFGISLAITDLYDHASIDELTPYIHSKKNIIIELQSDMNPESKSEPKHEPNSESTVVRETSVSVDVTAINDILADLAARILQVERSLIESGKKYYALGFDSLTIVDFLNLANKKFGTKLAISDLYDFSSIDELGAYLSTQKNINVLTEPDASDSPIPVISNEAPNERKEAVNTNKKIAIIGLACKYGGANSADEYWNNLKNGIDSIQVVPEKRWSITDYYDPDMRADNKTMSKWGGFVSDIDRFDADFFSITPIESENMDPQQRICLEECYHALEDAGYSEHDLSKKNVGVFIGARPGDYINLIKEGGHPPNPYSLMGNDFAILAARVAYVLNLKGPAISLDTACSSSLVAIHLAASSILKGECEMALAGGICIMSTPDLYLTSSKLGMLSPDGKCKAFDNRANGFVPGEGAGIVVLKELDQAISDNDHIYGVISASGINQDGKTNGITAPSALSQINLLRTIYEDNQIDPASIDYVETHGTGTKLGDPIEIKALSEVFGENGIGNEVCPIGSVKTNIGHTIGAAGVAGLIKIILSLKHQAIPPTLHYEQANEHIDFKNSPFYVNTELKEWRLKSTPRKAAVSSFGFSGTNSHVVIEEYSSGEKRANSEQSNYLIPISAKSRESLRGKINQLHAWLNASDGQTIGDIAFTLSVGRTHFDERISFIVENKEQLLAILEKGYMNVPGKAAVNPNSTVSDNLVSELMEMDPDSRTYKEHLESLSDLYVSGCKINWGKLYANRQHQRISLPVYPFEKKRYWIEPAHNEQSRLITSVQRTFFDNILRERHNIHYTVNLNNQSELVKDHVIHEDVVVPGAFYLEMVMKALEMCHVTYEEITIDNLRLLQSVVLREQDTCLTLSLDTSAMTFVVSSGYNIVVTGAYSTSQDHIPESFDLDHFVAQAHVSFDKHEIYRQHLATNVQYGPTYRIVQMVYDGKDDLLARVDDGLEPVRYENGIIHPILLDGALHAVAGSEQMRSLNATYLPYSIGKVRVYRKLVSPCYSRIHISDHNVTNRYIKCQIAIYDRDGQLLVKIEDFILKALPEKEPKLFYYAPQWIERSIERGQSFKQETVILLDRDESNYQVLTESNLLDKVILVKVGPRFKAEHPIYQIDVYNEHDYQLLLEHFESHAIDFTNLLVIPDITNNNESPLTQAEEVVHPLFLLCKALMKVTGKRRYNVLTLLNANHHEKYPFYAGLGPMMQTISLEHPTLRFRTLAHNWLKMDARKVFEELFHDAYSNEIKYDHNVRMEKEIQEAKVASPSNIEFKGVYLITGGLGGIGHVVANHLSRYPLATIVLLGRSLHDSSTKRLLASIQGDRVIYKTCDLSVESDVKQVITDVTREFGPVKGIFHCAGVINDRLFFQKEWSDFEKVLKPKVAGTVYLNKHTENLDFMMYFSSITSTFGKKGQSDYAYANGFMDYFAAYREGECQKGYSSGKTISVNWPLWLSGGMQLSEADKHRMKQEKGWEGLPDEVAIDALFSILSSGYQNIGVLYGQEINLGIPVNQIVTDQSAESNPIRIETSQPEIDKEQVKEEIAEMIAAVTKMSVKQVIGKKNFEQFDFNSLMIMEMTDRLEKVFGSISSTLFYEYNSLDDLADYLIDHYHEILLTKYAASTNQVVRGEDELFQNRTISAGKPEKVFREASTLDKEERTDASSHSNYPGVQDIAIIGLAGRYPGANSADGLWELLKNGKSSISEIPKDRWNWKTYYTEDKKAYGGIYTKWGGFIDDVDKFDPIFFGISPREAEQMDPQERLFLETVYASIEDAGYTPDNLCASRKVGVFVGAMNADYITGASFWSIANRVSYVMNFQGPSMAVDTACSSSLVGIHLAVESLYNGTSECVIAGGVNLIVDPYHYQRLSGKTMLSPGRDCKAFGAGADGFVDGEGVGAVVLKTLSAAERDGDHIYGVIKGTMINAGGRTNGYTVPNPNMQRQLIKEALQRANMDARTISYIEAHGTGTELGDPIEVAALAGAFEENTTDKQFCAIGSIKSNIGHLESAAGIAGLTKVLLQMKYGQIAPSLHATELNPRINFSKMPFFVQQELSEWVRPIINNTRYPRRAGLSSFGAGGANAHVIIEEYVPTETRSDDQTLSLHNPMIILLSAKSDEKLREHAGNLLTWIKKGERKNRDLISIAYTLQVGRVAMEERLAMTVTSLEQLERKLNAYVEDLGEADSIYRGQVTGDKALGSLLGFDEDIQFAIESWINKGKYDRLLGLWVTGLEVDWAKLYDQRKPERIGLPTYPYARERYWLTEREAPAKKNDPVFVQVMGYLNPLLHRNTSNLEEQRFSSTLTGKEFFLKDHVVMGEKILPGAAYMEMTRAALRQSALWGVDHDIRIKNIIWSTPFAVNGPSQELHIGIYPEEDREIGFEIYSEVADGDEETVIHCQGRAVFMSKTNHGHKQVVDIRRMQADCSDRFIGSDECYERFSSFGVDYGSGHKGIECLYIGEGQVLAKLTIPESVTVGADDYILHPSLIDSAIQATIGLSIDNQAREGVSEPTTKVPFALEELDIIGRCSERMWAIVRTSDSVNTEQHMQKLDIDLCDENGVIQVRMRKFAFRALEAESEGITYVG